MKNTTIKAIFVPKESIIEGKKMQLKSFKGVIRLNEEQVNFVETKFFTKNRLGFSIAMHLIESFAVELDKQSGFFNILLKLFSKDEYVFTTDDEYGATKFLKHAHKIKNIEEYVEDRSFEKVVANFYENIQTDTTYGLSFTGVKEKVKMVYLALKFDHDLAEGGLYHFYADTTNFYVDETMTALSILGADKAQEVIQKANKLFNPDLDLNVPLKRIENLKKIIDEKSIAERFLELDKYYFSEYHDLPKLVYEFIQLNREDFEEYLD